MSKSIFNSPRSLYKAFALSEGVTWALLIGGLTIRAIFPGAPGPLITIVGGIHGAVFLGYGVSAALVGVNNRWGFGRTVLAIALAIIPFATVPFEMVAERKGRLVGSWRKTKSQDPRDNNWFDSLYRWFINRPVLLGLTLLVVVVAIFAALLFIGPPGGWPQD
jgi:integral membrane protein